MPRRPRDQEAIEARPILLGGSRPLADAFAVFDSLAGIYGDKTSPKPTQGMREACFQRLNELKDLKTIYMSGFASDGLPIVEELTVARVFEFGLKRQPYFRIIIEFTHSPFNVPMNKSRYLSSKIDVDDRTKEYRKLPYHESKMITLQQMAKGSKKASFHFTRQGAIDRIDGYIKIRERKAHEEYRYVTQYRQRVEEMKNGVDHVEIQTKQEIEKITEQPKRKMTWEAQI